MNKIKGIVITAIIAVILCSMALTVSAATHSLYQDTKYPTTTPKINIKSSVQARFFSDNSFSYAYAAIRYDEYNSSDDLTNNNVYKTLWVKVTQRYTTDYTHSINGNKTLYINDTDNDYYGVRHYYKDTEEVKNLYCIYEAKLTDQNGKAVSVPTILANYGRLS